MGHPGKAGTTVGVEKHQVSSATAKKGSHPIPSHPIPSHPFLSRTSSHPTSPHPTLRTQRARAASTHNEETRRAGSFHGSTDSRDGHVPSAKACQVPGRAKCQGARPKDARGKQDKHGEHAQRAHTTRRRDAQADSTGAQTVATITCQVPRRAKCQGEPSAKAPGRSATTTRRNTQAPATDPLARQERTTTHRGQDARAKCQEEQSSKKQCSWRTFMWAMPCGWEICAPCTDRTRAGRAARRCISHGRACAWSRARWSEGAGVAAREAHHTFLPRCGILRRSMHMLMEATTAARKRLSNGLVRRVSR